MKSKLLYKLVWLECHLFKKDIFFLVLLRSDKYNLGKIQQGNFKCIWYSMLKVPSSQDCQIVQVQTTQMWVISPPSTLEKMCGVESLLVQQVCKNTHVDSPLALTKHASFSAESKWRGVFFGFFFLPHLQYFSYGLLNKLLCPLLICGGSVPN